MFEWKVEEMTLMKNHTNAYRGIYKVTIFDCENSVSREDKIAFVDNMTDGKLSYILSLIEKFNADKENLPKDKYGKVKTASLKAWVKRNDTRYQQKVIDDWYQYGKYNLLGCERYIQSDTKGQYDYYEDLVDEIFHRQLMKCEGEERKYFREHDEYSILKKRYREKNYDTTFGVRICEWSTGILTIADDNDNERDITIDELKELLSKYEQLDALVKKLTEETHIVY